MDEVVFAVQRKVMLALPTAAPAPVSEGSMVLPAPPLVTFTSVGPAELNLQVPMTTAWTFTVWVPWASAAGAMRPEAISATASRLRFMFPVPFNVRFGLVGAEIPLPALGGLP